MRESAEIVIIGAGIMGCAIAHALAEKGQSNVVVLERDQIARGATADAAGGIRQQFSSATNIELATWSVRVWETYEERFGVDINFRQQGYLFLLDSPAEEATFRKNLALQQSMGVPSRWVTPDEIRELNPYILLDNVVGGTFCPEDGWADTYNCTLGFARAARDLGVEIREETTSPGSRLRTAASPASRPQPERSPPTPSSSRPAHKLDLSAIWPASSFRSIRTGA
ncbi:MAG: FAD-dependent oxidoreductase [Thermomicrobiales bacterium]